MVQRKVANKLAVQAESSKSYAASEKRSMALKPCYQHHDGKNKKGGEIKKNMKKSRSYKGLDIENLRSPLRRSQTRFKKLSVDASGITASQKKASPVKISDCSPNYMKPTSSSDARKESLHSQVTPQSQTCDKNKSQVNSNRSKHSSVSGLKNTKILMRNSSLKPVRPSMKKSYGMPSYYPNLNVSRVTCSSTLKDSKFPAYVELQPGATELEGASVMKVCPYTYCSLNGHIHAALPPLKRFLSARRRLLKTQKSMKLKVLSSPRQKGSGQRKREIDTGQMGFDEDPVTSEPESAGSAICHVLEEVYTDFFVEIFAKPIEESAISENHGENRTQVNEPEFKFSAPEVLKQAFSDGRDETPPPSSSESTETYMEDNEVIESPLNDNLVQNDDLFIAEMGISMKLPVDAEFDQVETSYECCMESKMTKETETNRDRGMDHDESISDATDMDWENEGEPDFDNGVDYSAFSEDQFVSLTPHLQENEDPHELSYDPDYSAGFCGEVPEEAIILQVNKEDAESFMNLFGSYNYEKHNFKLDDGDESSEIHEVSDAADLLNHNHPSVVESESQVQYDEITVLHQEDPDTNSDTQDGTIYDTSFTDFAENVPWDPTEAESTTNPEEEKDFTCDHAPFGNDTDGILDQPICATELRYLECDPDTEQGAAKGEHGSDNQHPDTESESAELNEIDQSGVLDDETAERVDLEMDHLVITCNYSQEQVLQCANVGDVAEKKEKIDSDILLNIKFSKFSKTDQDTGDADQTYIDIEVRQCGDSKTKENRCGQEAESELSSINPDQSIPPPTQSTVGAQQGMHNTEENKDSGKDQGKLGYLYTSKSTCSEECDGTVRFNSSEDCIRNDDEMQTEDKSMMGAGETYVAPNIKSPEKDEAFTSAGNNSHKPLPRTYDNLKWKTNKVGKRPSEDSDQLKKFNPRPPRYLLPEPDPEAERVDLRHQTMDERKNAEEWMIDYALQQTVNKLAPARKRRVALLVEAFEAVMPLPKYEAHLRHAAASFTHARPIQACR